MGIVITGGGGFIGRNLRQALPEALIFDFDMRHELLRMLETGPKPDVIFHQGAYTDTTYKDVQSVLENNYYYSCQLLDLCEKNDIYLLYASSASVYGKATIFKEGENENPETPYAYSKLLFDNYVRSSGYPLVTGLRYFNVYGPDERKGKMDSLISQLPKTKKLFKWGEQKRDFVFVEDIVRVNLWFMHNPTYGIFNVGTGEARSFNEIAEIMNITPDYIDNPYPHFQDYTCADISKLRSTGYDHDFTPIEQGICS